jgi:uracil-DNA glycosylase
MNKIVIIGQALPAKEQTLPYDSTMLYDWLAECGVCKQQAQEMFIFTSIGGELRGVKNGSHLLPLKQQKDTQYTDVVLPLILENKKCILLGNVAQEYVLDRKLKGIQYLSLLHPSKRNYHRYTQNKIQILKELSDFINH